ncbi:MAG: DNA recombination protein RmuC [Flavobacteriaceae bacterium]
MELILLGIIALLVAVTLFLLVKQKNTNEGASTLNAFIKFEQQLAQIEKQVKDDAQRNREESQGAFKLQREELTKSLAQFEERFENNSRRLNEILKERFSSLNEKQNQLNLDAEKRIKEVRETVERQLKELREDNSKQLAEVNKTVNEKLQKTLNERLSQSFETVGKQLKSVQEGLGEMKTLATDVGGLKKVLSNVKMRGGFGEVQLSMLLENILAPDQYEANVKTKIGSDANVEFAIKLPGKENTNAPVWIPVDAKFPKDIYENLQNAYEDGAVALVEQAQKELETTIKKMAKDIRDKYIDPPNTTDFAIMFLPFEGIYAEVVRKAALLESLQRDYKVIVTGPTTLAAILNSLQMGFKTLAIQKRSSEVWNVLGEVKKEFSNFGGMMQKAQKNIQTGLSQLDDVMGVRTRAIERKLKDVSRLDEGPSSPQINTSMEENLLDFEQKTD